MTQPDLPSPVSPPVLRVFTPTLTFRAAAIFLLVAALWLGSQVVRQPTLGAAVLWVITLAMAAMLLPAAFARAEFDGSTLTYHMPLRPARQVERRQIDKVEVVGRRTRALLLSYHPLDAQGRPDPEQWRYLNLAPLQNQMDLWEELGGEDGSTRRAGSE